MKPLRLVFAAVVGGIILFVWGAIAHMALPVGEMGMKPLPAEGALLSAMQVAIPRHGLYVFPGAPEGASLEELAAWKTRYESGPRGLLVFDPKGAPLMDPRQLAIELASNIAAAFLAACIMGSMRAPLPARALAGVALGLIGWLNIDVSYSNWYLFPREHALGALIEQTVGWLAAGLAIALIAGRPRHRPLAAPPAA